LTATNKVYSKFVPTQFLQHLKREKITEVVLGDETRTDMGVLFSDIRSFTAMAAHLGDGIMALFPGNPHDGPRAAARMLGALRRLNARRSPTPSTAHRDWNP
jgi:class 3 adenylate cyclase